MNNPIILVLLVLCAPLALAADWQKFSETADRSDLLDRSTLVRKGEHVRSWSKVSFSTPQVFKGGGADGVRYNSALQFADFDCDSREIYMILVNYFGGHDADGQLLHTEKPVPGERPTFMPVAPDSIGESWMKMACSMVKR